MGALDEAPRVAFADAAAWRAWLEEHHEASAGVFLLRAKAASARPLIDYEDMVRQALCFGWVDGPVRPHDAEATVIWFSPRKPASGWAATNKRRVIALEESGEMTDAGRRAIAVAQANGWWEVLDGPEAGIETPELTAALDAVPAARAAWDAFPASARKFGLSMIAIARRPETKTARIAKIVADAAEGKRPS
jgi:uncharacterized protein YdeI (YjbR/CyaY-like superfamily)